MLIENSERKSVGRPRVHRGKILEILATRNYEVPLNAKKITDLLNQKCKEEEKQALLPAIHREIQSMVTDGLIYFKDPIENERGKLTNYYDVTFNGIKEYLGRILETNRRFFTPKLFEDFLNTDDSFNPEYEGYDVLPQGDKFRKKILQKIGFEKPITFEKLIDFLNIKKTRREYLGKNKKSLELMKDYPSRKILPYDTENINNFFNTLIQDLMDLKIIKIQTIDNKRKYELTHLGFLKLLYHIYNDKETISKFRTKKFNSAIGKLLKKYSCLLPDILENDNIKKLGIEPYQIGLLLIYEFEKDEMDFDYDDEKAGNNMNIENIVYKSFEYHTIQSFKKLRQNFYQEKLSKNLKNLQYNIENNNYFPNKLTPIQILPISAEDYLKIKDIEDKVPNEPVLGIFNELVGNRMIMDFCLLYKLCFPKESQIFFKKNKLLKLDFKNYYDDLISFSKDKTLEIIETMKRVS